MSFALLFSFPLFPFHVSVSIFAIDAITIEAHLDIMASATATATRSEITIKGSVEIVTEFFGYAVNSILYQRGIYPPESFTSVAKYGLSLLVTSDEGLKTYLAQVLRQVAAWLSKGQVQKFVVVITGLESKAVLERWAFNVITDKTALVPGCGATCSCTLRRTDLARASTAGLHHGRSLRRRYKGRSRRLCAKSRRQ